MFSREDPWTFLSILFTHHAAVKVPNLEMLGDLWKIGGGL
jgi:hypothetical protein